MTSKPSLLFERLNKSHQRQSFDCGVDVLNTYLKTRSNQDHRNNVAFSYVMTFDSEKQVRGFYTLSAASVLLDDLPAELAKRTRYELVPAVLIGRLAVDTGLRGQGYGQLVLIDALRRIARASDFAVMAVIVDAKDDDAKSFYTRFGFLPLEGKKGNRLFIPFESIKNL